MLRLVLLTIGVTSCTYAAGVEPGTGSGSADAALSDAALVDTTLVTPDGQSPVDAPPPLSCAAPDTAGLVLCLELDDPGLTTATDTSTHGHNAVISNVTVANPARTVPAVSQAAQITPTSSIRIPDSSDFNAQKFTVMAWVHREALPATNTAYGLIDVGFQYQMRIDDQSQVICDLVSGGTAYAAVGNGVALNEWDLVACTYDGAELCATVFRNGSANAMSGCMAWQKTVNMVPISGISIADLITPIGSATGVRLVGKLDSVRVFTRALTQQQLCLAGGITGC